MAKKISELREELEELQDSYDVVFHDAVCLIEAARQEHDNAHTGVLRWCDSPMCRLAGELDPTYPR
jgi:hypothetical protein